MKVKSGVVSIRGPDGQIYNSVPVYRNIPDELVTVAISSSNDDSKQETVICEFSDSVFSSFAKEISKLRIKK